jgi:hypothetical protein
MTAPAQFGLNELGWRNYPIAVCVKAGKMMPDASFWAFQSRKFYLAQGTISVFVS